MSLRARLEKNALRSMLALPRGLRRRLVAFAEPLARRDLDVDLRTVLAASSLRPPLESLPPKVARKVYSELFQLLDVPREAVAAIKDHSLKHDTGHFRVRVYRPLGVGDLALPGILFFHGGGHTIGSVEDYDHSCRMLANRCGAIVASVDYRLAPEHRFPAAAEDALAAWAWFTDNAVELGVDPKRLAVMGDSAGGNLAIVVAQQARRCKMPRPAVQCLVYPTTDARRNTDSMKALGEHLGLTRALIGYFDGHYLGDPADAKHPEVSPILHRNLKTQPKTLLAVCKDPLRDEGLAYGKRLADAGVAVTTLDYPQLIHGFYGMGGMVPAARTALLEIFDTLGKML